MAPLHLCTHLLIYIPSNSLCWNLSIDSIPLLSGGTVVCRATMAIGSAVFSPTAMRIGGILFSLTTMGIWGVVFCQATSVIGSFVFRRTTLAIHNNQPKEGHVAKMPATEVKQLATTSRCNKRTRGQHNTSTSASTALRWWR
jgi:hypothetical protein